MIEPACTTICIPGCRSKKNARAWRNTAWSSVRAGCASSSARFGLLTLACVLLSHRSVYRHGRRKTLASLHEKGWGREVTRERPHSWASCTSLLQELGIGFFEPEHVRLTLENRQLRVKLFRGDTFAMFGVRSSSCGVQEPNCRRTCEHRLCGTDHPLELSSGES